MKKLNETKSFIKSKTIWLGIFTVGLAGLEFWRNNAISPNVIAILGIIIIGLRFLTTKKISLK